MSEIVRQSGGFYDVRINAAKRFGFVWLRPSGMLGKPPSYLGDFQRVRQPVPEDVTLACGGYLGDAAKPSEGGRV